MVKAYLRYVPEEVFGVAASPECNVVFDSRGQNVVAAVNELVNVWNVKRGAVMGRLAVEARDDLETKFHHHATRLARHPTQPMVAVGYHDGSIRLWRLLASREVDESRGPVATFHGHKHGVTALAFSHDGHLLASGGADTDIVVWDLVSQSGQFRLRGHRNAITCLKFYHPSAPAKGEDEEVPFWRFKGSPEYLISGAKDALVKVWDLKTQWCIQTVVDHHKEVWSLAMDARQTRLIVGSSEPHLRVYQLAPDLSASVQERRTSDEASGERNGVVESTVVVPEVLILLGKVDRQAAKGRVVDLHLATDLPHFVAVQMRRQAAAAASGGATGAGEAMGAVTDALGARRSGSFARGGAAGVADDARGEIVQGAIFVESGVLMAPDMTSVLVAQTSTKSLEFFVINSQAEVERRRKRRKLRSVEKLQRKKKALKVLQKMEEELDKAMFGGSAKGGKAAKSKSSRRVESAGGEVGAGARQETKEKIMNLENEIAALKESSKSEVDDTKDGGAGGDGNVNDQVVSLRVVKLKRVAAAVDFHEGSQRLALSLNDGTLEVRDLPLPRVVEALRDETSERTAIKRKANRSKVTAGELGESESEDDAGGSNKKIEEQVDFLDFWREFSTKDGDEDGDYGEAPMGAKCTNESNAKLLEMVSLGAFKLESPNHPEVIRSLAFSHNDTMIMSTENDCVKIWNTRSRRCVRSFSGCGLALCGIFVAGNAHVVVGTAEGCVFLYDLNSAKALAPTGDPDSVFHQGRVEALARHPAHTGFVSVSADKTLKLFEFYLEEAEGDSGEADAHTAAMRKSKEVELMDAATDVKYSSDGKLIAVSLLDNRMQVFYADTLHLFLTLYGHKLPVTTLAISTDNTILASGSADKSIKIWGLDFGNIQRSFNAHEEAVTNVEFIYDTHYLVSTGQDGIVKLWDIDTKELIVQLLGHHKAITSLAVSQDGDRIVTSGYDKSIRMWIRTDEQFVLEEEREREMEAQMEREALRDDIGAAAQVGPEVTEARATRRTMDNVKSTERMMEVLDQAKEQHDSDIGYRVLLAEWVETVERIRAGGGKDVELPMRPAPPGKIPQLMGKSPHEFVTWAASSLTANNVYEVLIAMPFAYAERLVCFLTDFLEGYLGCDSISDQSSTVAYPVETLLRVALIVVHLHHRLLVVSPEHRALLLRLQWVIRTLVDREAEGIAFCRHSLAFLRKQATVFTASTADAFDSLDAPATGSKHTKKRFRKQTPPDRKHQEAAKKQKLECAYI